MKIKSQYTMTIGTHFLSPIYNADLSGLEGSDLEDAEKLINDIGTGCVSIVNDDPETGYEAFFARCEVTGLMSDCVEIEVTHFSSRKPRKINTENLGTVLEIRNNEHTGHSTMVIQLDTGKFEMFFSEFRGWNKSLRVGHRVEVFYKESILAGRISYKATRVKNEKPTLSLVG